MKGTERRIALDIFNSANIPTFSLVSGLALDPNHTNIELVLHLYIHIGSTGYARFFE
jgi:hypothetical protein